MKDAKALFQERKELFDNAIALKHNKRVPIVSNYWTWKILDAGCTLSEAICDWDVMTRVVLEHQEKYCFDGLVDCGGRNNNKLTRAMGYERHLLNDEAESITVLDNLPITAEDYPIYRKSSQEFWWKCWLGRMNPDMTKEQFLEGVSEFFKFLEFGDRVKAELLEKYGALAAFPMPYMAPMELLFNQARGIKGLSLDMRRHPEELMDILDAIFETEVLPAVTAAAEGDYTNYITAMETIFLAHSIMNTKQFARFYWPHFLKITQIMFEKGQKIYTFSEAYIDRFSDFLQDIPEGMMILHPEQDDIFELRKKIPHICIAGGMPASYLGYKSEEECVDYARKLVSEMGDGYIFSQDKMGTFRADARPENVKAVNDFVRSYEL